MPFFRLLFKTVIVSSSFLSIQLGFAFDYRILVLPSGGATGIITATSLVQIEQLTGRPIYEHFHEIWASSIGTMIAAHLTIPTHETSLPKSALQTQQFIEEVFSSYWKASGILKEFKKSMSMEPLLKDTLIPIRILSAEVKSWKWGYLPVPSETELKCFSNQESGKVSLNALACGSCTVPPVNWYEPILLENNRMVYHLDPGHEFCTEPCMNPLFHILKEFSKKIDPNQDQLSIFFLSNGWVRLDTSFGTQNAFRIRNQEGEALWVKLFNLDIDLSPVIQEWGKNTWTGKALTPVSGEYTLFNLAGMGTIPLHYLKKHTEAVLKNSPILNAIIEALRNTKE